MTAPGVPTSHDDALAVPGVLTSAECEALARRVLGQLVHASRAEVRLWSEATSIARFARGRADVATQVCLLEVRLAVEVAGRCAKTRTNQIDAAGLRALVSRAEDAARENRSLGGVGLLSPQHYPEGPRLFYDATVAAMAGDAQAALVQRATEAAETAGLVAAGEVETRVASRAVHNTDGTLGYETTTYGGFSVTTRSAAARRGSGWAWSGFEDWARVDAAAVIQRAVDLGTRSMDPVAIEPGHYTVILEPAAVAELIEQIGGAPTVEWGGIYADRGEGVFAKDPIGTNKIGLQMLDRRLAMTSSPWDPDRPSTTIGPYWRPIPAPVTWFEHGVLQNLAFPPEYARETGRRTTINPGGVRLTVEGPAQTLDEMIASTKRGVWVNRLSHVTVMDSRTVLLTGTTRDGTFLIENGKITKPIKNLRFTDSPFFVLNRLEAWGEPVRASRNAIAPRLMLRDFNFTSATDAI